jgi:hypothetical protein
VLSDRSTEGVISDMQSHCDIALCRRHVGNAASSGSAECRRCAKDPDSRYQIAHLKLYMIALHASMLRPDAGRYIPTSSLQLTTRFATRGRFYLDDPREALDSTALRMVNWCDHGGPVPGYPSGSCPARI